MKRDKSINLDCSRKSLRGLKYWGPIPLKLFYPKNLLKERIVEMRATFKRTRVPAIENVIIYILWQAERPDCEPKSLAKAKDQRLKRPHTKRASPINTNQNWPDGFHPRNQALLQKKPFNQNKEQNSANCDKPTLNAEKTKTHRSCLRNSDINRKAKNQRIT